MSYIIHVHPFKSMASQAGNKLRATSFAWKSCGGNKTDLIEFSKIMVRIETTKLSGDISLSASGSVLDTVDSPLAVSLEMIFTDSSSLTICLYTHTCSCFMSQLKS